jgi:hypothetical protein
MTTLTKDQELTWNTLKRAPIGSFHCKYVHSEGYDKATLEQFGWNEEDYAIEIVKYIQDLSCMILRNTEARPVAKTGFIFKE